MSMAPVHRLQCTMVQSLLACYCASMLVICLDMPATKLHCGKHITHTHSQLCTHLSCIKRVLWGGGKPHVQTGFGTQAFVFGPCCRPTSPDNRAIESEFALTHSSVSGIGVCGVDWHKQHKGRM